jgi:hypothetical protein
MFLMLFKYLKNGDWATDCYAREQGYYLLLIRASKVTEFSVSLIPF